MADITFLKYLNHRLKKHNISVNKTAFWWEDEGVIIFSLSTYQDICKLPEGEIINLVESGGPEALVTRVKLEECFGGEGV